LRGVRPLFLRPIVAGAKGSITEEACRSQGCADQGSADPREHGCQSPTASESTRARLTRATLLCRANCRWFWSVGKLVQLQSVALVCRQRAATDRNRAEHGGSYGQAFTDIR
jgi:hypothetical protein